ncbi:MAG TPA: biotin/lipoyl-containing protein, partial [Puia sp.]|nr:biotin/lipoyl-containing protein [Puia sp.]
MAEVIKMPRLSDTMTEGVIAAWHKKVGDPVKKGELLAEVETDKATMDLESYKDGTLLYTGTEKGGKIQVDELLAIIGAPGEDISALVKGGAAAPVANRAAAPVAAAPAASAAPAPSAPAAGGSASAGSAVANAVAASGLDLSKMEEVILMPRLSDTMTEGVIADWHKKVGDMVKKGDVLADIETDKATMELESYKEGKLLYIGAQKGDKIAINSLLAVIGDEKKVDLEKIKAAAHGGGTSAGGVVATTTEAGGASGATAPAAAEAGHSGLSVSADGRIKASPLAKKLAAEKGIDISQVPGSGDNG